MYIPWSRLSHCLPLPRPGFWAVWYLIFTSMKIEAYSYLSINKDAMDSSSLRRLYPYLSVLYSRCESNWRKRIADFTGKIKVAPLPDVYSVAQNPIRSEGNSWRIKLKEFTWMGVYMAFCQSDWSATAGKEYVCSFMFCISRAYLILKCHRL